MINLCIDDIRVKLGEFIKQMPKDIPDKSVLDKLTNKQFQDLVDSIVKENQRLMRVIKDDLTTYTDVRDIVE